MLQVLFQTEVGLYSLLAISALLFLSIAVPILIWRRARQEEASKKR